MRVYSCLLFAQKSVMDNAIQPTLSASPDTHYEPNDYMYAYNVSSVHQVHLASLHRYSFHECQCSNPSVSFGTVLDLSTVPYVLLRYLAKVASRLIDHLSVHVDNHPLDRFQR